MTRREWLALLGPALKAQDGMATRGVKPMPRGKPSGKPFYARFTDVAAQVGLRAPIICAARPRGLHHRNNGRRDRVSGLRQRRLARYIRPRRFHAEARSAERREGEERRQR